MSPEERREMAEKNAYFMTGALNCWVTWLPCECEEPDCDDQEEQFFGDAREEAIEKAVMGK